MVRHTFSSGVFFGPNRRSLRSDKATYVSGTQMNSDSNNWKNSLPSARRASLPPFSNGHHLRSGKLLEKTTKTTGQNDSMEVQCNGVNPSHCYGTRYGGRNAEQNHQKFSPTRKSNHWDGPLVGGRPKRTRTTSASFLNLPETDHLSPTGSDLGPKLRSRHVWFPNNLISISSDVDDGSKHSCTKQYEALTLGKSVQDYKEDFNSTLTGSDFKIKEEKVCKNPEGKHCHNQLVKRKRLTAEEKLIEDNKAYYKLEVKNNKLRSSGYYIQQRESSVSFVENEPKETELEERSKETVITCNGEQTENVNPHKNITFEKSDSVIEVKRNKIRLSELSLLNNEAENFMFGELAKNDECSSDDSDYEDNKNNLGNNGICSEDAVVEDSKNNNGENLEINKCKSSLSEPKIAKKEKNLDHSSKDTILNIAQNFSQCSQNDVYNETQFDHESFQQKREKPFLNDSEYEDNMFEYCSLNNVDSNSVERRHRKRALSESQVHGNVACCKSEVSDVQSCVHAQTLPHTSVKMQNKLENENRNDGVVRTNSDCNPCRSENVNASLQSSSCDKFELKPSCVSKVGIGNENKDVRTKPSVKYPDVKSEAVTGLHFSFEGIPESEPWFQTYQRQDEGEEFYLSTVNDCTYWKSFLLPYEMPPEQFNTLSNNMGVPKTTKVTTIKRRKRKNNANALDKKPRKSPRCHASTLAILSSLMHHGKRRDGVSEDNLSRSVEEETNSSIANNANDSSQQMGINDLAQNVDQLLGLYSEMGASSDSHALSVDASDEMNHGKSHKLKGLKYKRLHKTVHSGNTKKSETDINMKCHEVIDVDPVVLEELAVSGENPLSCVDDLSIRNRGGPGMDVISLLNGYGNCCCVEGLMKNRDMSRYDDLHPSSRETCNSSECASSTGDTAQYSDVKYRVRGKKRKRKKNMTGWPVEKQKLKLKKRLLLKLARPELQAPVTEVKIKEERLVTNEDGISTSGPNKSKCLPCVEQQVGNDELAKQSEPSCTIESRSRNSINEVATENTSKKTINSRCIDVDVKPEIKTSASELIDHNDTSTVATPARTAEKLCMSRTASVDSNSQHCDFQPRVRVKKMNSVDDLNFVLKNSGSATSVNNTRQLRSASFSSSATLRKNSFHYDSIDTMEVVRRASGRMKKSCSRWDSWSTRRRR